MLQKLIFYSCMRKDRGRTDLYFAESAKTMGDKVFLESAKRLGDKMYLESAKRMDDKMYLSYKVTQVQYLTL